MASEALDRILAESHVVKDFYIENTRIIICDDYCRDKTKEDVDRILRRIGEITYRPLQVAALADLEAGGAGLGDWYDLVKGGVLEKKYGVKGTIEPLTET